MNTLRTALLSYANDQLEQGDLRDGQPDMCQLIIAGEIKEIIKRFDYDENSGVEGVDERKERGPRCGQKGSKYVRPYSVASFRN